ncbi:hypothetical protein HDR67_03250 [bacterium]|nr:hypothetical protein [bacterium]
MKKIFCIILLLLGLTSCKMSSPFDNQLPMKKEQVKINYSESSGTAIAFYTANIQNKNIYSKANPSKRLNTLVGGDEMELYYQDDSFQIIDHILVLEASVIEVSNEVVPGTDNKVDIFVPDSDSIVLDSSEIRYIIHKDGSFENLKQVKTGQKLYATYQKQEIKQTSEFTYLYKILAVYSYNPRP